MIAATHDCLAFGLRVRTPIPIPGAIALATAGEPDVEIRTGRYPDWDAAIAAGPYRAESADRFEFAMPELARFTCIDRRQVVVDARSDADPGHVGEMLIATVLPALLWAQGDIVLHAAVAVYPGATRAIAVAGPSGSGKSRWLAEALADGASAVADDCVCLRMAAGQASGSGLPAGYFRRTGAGPEARAFQAVPHDRQLSKAPVDTILVLTPDAPERRPLTGAAAVEALLRQRHRPRIAQLLGMEAALLPTIAGLAQSVAVFEVPIRREKAFQDRGPA